LSWTLSFGCCEWLLRLETTVLEAKNFRSSDLLKMLLKLEFAFELIPFDSKLSKSVKIEPKLDYYIDKSFIFKPRISRVLYIPNCLLSKSSPNGFIATFLPNLECELTEKAQKLCDKNYSSTVEYSRIVPRVSNTDE